MNKDTILKKIEIINEEIKKRNIVALYLNFIGPEGSVYTKAVLTSLEKEQISVSLIDGVGVNGRLIPEWSEYTSAEWLLLIPDLDTIKFTDLDEIYPSAFMMASFNSFPLDVRNCAKRVAEYARNMDFKLMNGVGLCYRIVDHKTRTGNGAYRLYPNSDAVRLNTDISRKLHNSGIPIEYFQSAGEQHNAIEFVPKDFLSAMDNLAIAKWYVMAVGIKENLNISFENPEYSIPMSENPIHFSIWNLEGNKNLFFEVDDDMELSMMGKCFIGGILRRFRELATIIMLSAGKTYIKHWSCTFSDERDNSIVHVPHYYKEYKKHDRVGWGKRVLFNGFLNGCNLHICASAVFLAGLEGILDEVSPGQYVNPNISTNIIDKDLLKKDSIFRQVLGDEIIDFLLMRDIN